MRLVLPTSARTFWFWIRSTASAATCCGSVCSCSAMNWIGRPLMPPLSFTQPKKACAMPVIGVKSVPGCLVTIAPSLIGAPVAFFPFPRPHLETGPPLVDVEPPVLLPPPHAATTTARQTASAMSAPPERGRSLPTNTLMTLLPCRSRLAQLAHRRRPVRATNLPPDRIHVNVPGPKLSRRSRPSLTVPFAHVDCSRAERRRRHHGRGASAHHRPPNPAGTQRAPHRGPGDRRLAEA